MIFAPFCLFPEEMFLRAALFGMAVIAAVVLPAVWFLTSRLLHWSATRNLKRIMEKEDAIRDMSTARVWH